LTGVFNQFSRAWVSGEGRIEDRRGSRNLADFIGTELRGAVLPVETVTPVGKGNLQFLINPPVKQLPEDYRNADSIFWQAPIATDASFGDLAEVGYFVKWLTRTNGTVQPVLCRFFVNPSLADAENPNVRVKNPNFLIYSPTSPDAWLSEDLIKEVAPATSDKGYAGLFAENVVGLWVRSYGLDGAELPKVAATPPRTFDSRKGYSLDFKYTDAAGKPQTRKEQRYLPAVVQISVAQLDSHYSARLQPVWEAMRDLVRKPELRDAREFLERFRRESDANPALRPLLPGLRIYSAEIHLENAR
jgi:hypothetical protein